MDGEECKCTWCELTETQKLIKIFCESSHADLKPGYRYSRKYIHHTKHCRRTSSCAYCEDGEF